MRITLLGSGHTATILGRLCIQNGHQVQQIIARNSDAGKVLGNEFGCSYINFKEKPDLNTQLVLIALSDNSMPEALDEIYFDSIPAVHTSGSIHINVIQKVSKNFGVLYPLQSLRKEMETIPEIPFLIEANNSETLAFIKDFANTISNTVVEQNADERLRLHASAVIVNNFTNHLYSIAEKFCINEKVDFNLLKPIIKETADRIQHHSPSAVQTGPAMRSDITTLDKHLRLLNDYPKLRTLYMRMTDGIMNG